MYNSTVDSLLTYDIFAINEGVSNAKKYDLSPVDINLDVLTSLPFTASEETASQFAYFWGVADRHNVANDPLFADSAFRHLFQAWGRFTAARVDSLVRCYSNPLVALDALIDGVGEDEHTANVLRLFLDFNFFNLGVDLATVSDSYGLEF